MRWIKAGLSSAVVCVGFVARELNSGSALWVRYSVYALAVVLVFLVNAWELKPDKRLEKLRKPILDKQFQSLFDKISNKKKIGERLPIRANIMVPRFAWRCWKRLEIHYAYNMRPSDPDFGYMWDFGKGQCWHVLRNGKAKYVRCSPEVNSSYKLSKKDGEATSHLYAILSVPVRLDDEKMKSKVHAVLNFDALTEEAASELEEIEAKLNSGDSMDDILKTIGLLVV